MSLANAHFVKASGLVGPNPRRERNDNRNNRRDDRRDDRNRDRNYQSGPSSYSKNYDTRSTKSIAGSKVRFWGDEPDDTGRKDEQTEPTRGSVTRNIDEPKIRHQAEKEVLDNFKCEYIAHNTDTRWLTDYLVDTMPSVCKIVKHYPETKWDDLSQTINGVLSIMATKQFSELLMAALKRNEMEDWDNCWNDVAVTLSILVTTTENQMKEETLNTYVYEIIPSGALWGREVEEMQSRFGITKEMAIELVINVPFVDMDNVQLSLCYDGVREAILAHAEENCEVLDSSRQRELFKYFFGTGDTCLKAIGRNLAAEPIVPDEGIQKTMYDEYVKALYECLDMFDVDQVQYVLKYITNEKKKLATTDAKQKETVFNASEALKYSTISKAMGSLIASNDDARRYLV